MSWQPSAPPTTDEAFCLEFLAAQVAEAHRPNPKTLEAAARMHAQWRERYGADFPKIRASKER